MGPNADVAQLVERNLAKVEVAGSSPVVRSRRGPWHRAGALLFSVPVFPPGPAYNEEVHNKRFASNATRISAAALAASAGTAASIAATDAAGAQPVSASASGPSVEAGTMQSCVPYFGLTKQSSNLVRFDVQTSGPVQGVPAIGTNLMPVLTLTDAAHASISCRLDADSLAWTSQSTFFSDYLGGNGSIAGPYEYPGSNDFYETPALGFEFTIGGQAFTPVSASIAVHTSLPGVTVTLSTTAPEDLNHGFFTWGGNTTSPTDPVVARSSQRMLDAGGSHGAANMLAKLQVTNTCTAGPAALASYNDHIGQLFSDASSPAANCQEAENHLDWAFVYYSSLLQVQVQGSPVTVTVSAPEPTTTLVPTTLAPSPSLAATGSSARTLLGGAGILAGLGALLAVQGRRLRRRHQG